MTDLNNPETIEIHGLRTITKLCHFGADNNMEGCTFTEIVERLFAELEKAKAQAVPEGYCLVPKTPTQKMIDGSHGLCLPQDVYKAMLRLNEFKAQDKVIIEGDKRVWNIDTINSNGFHATTINKPTRCLIHVFGDQHVRHATNEEIREASESGAEG
ncbi:DUF551 domain-containing protein [Acinetobacter baumannii]